jgi:hypothetical protein
MGEGFGGMATLPLVDAWLDTGKLAPPYLMSQNIAPG